MEKKQRILITGGTGFIGTYFVREFLKRGHELVLLDLHPPEGEQEMFAQTTFIQGDIRDAELLINSMQGCDKVLHLAAAHHDFGIKRETFDAVNVHAAQTICDAMDANGIKDICFFSTVAIYGTTAPPIVESTAPAPKSDYGDTKLGGENVFKKWSENGEDRKCLFIRPTVTFGAGNFANMFTLIKQIDKGAYLPVGTGTNIKSLSYVENIIAATLTMWSKPEDQRTSVDVFNYVCKPDLSSSEIADCIYEALGKKKPKLKIPYFLARALAVPFDLVIMLTGKNLPVSGTRIKKLAKSTTQFESRRIRDAGFDQQIPVREGIRRMVAWYQKSGKEEAQKGVKRRLPPETPILKN